MVLHIASLTTLALSLGFVFTIISVRRWNDSRHLSFPPGPKISWFGATSLPTVAPWMTYHKWRDTYGDLVFFKILGQPTLILNSAKVTRDLLETHGSIFSSRAHFVMETELMGWEWGITGMPYGKRLQEHRTMLNKYMSPENAIQHHSMETMEARKLARNLLHETHTYNPGGEVHRSITSIMMQIAYGHEIMDESDHFAVLASKAVERVGTITLHGLYLVNFIPMLKYVPSWLPGARFKKNAEIWSKEVRAMIDEPFEMAKRRMNDGAALPCIVTHELESAPLVEMQSGLSEPHEAVVKNVAGICYSAGVDTTAASIMSFFLAMILHPEIQTQAQLELDKVVGDSRLPTFSDRSSLPSIDSILWESSRWQPVAPLAMSHLSIEDYIYAGHFIPKGTMLFPNTWSILHDPETYPNPLVFDPDRYKPENTKNGLNPIPVEVFGYGRRACPGRPVALDIMWITIATILSVYTISKAVDKDGNAIQPDTTYDSGLVSRPKPFTCLIQARSSAALTLIQHLDMEHSEAVSGGFD